MNPDLELTMSCDHESKVGSNCTFACPPDQVSIKIYFKNLFCNKIKKKILIA